MLNALPVASAVRQPRAVIEVSGAEVRGWKSWRVTTNAYYEADTFEVVFAVNALPAGNSADWFSGQTEIFVEIFAGFPSNPSAPDKSELTSLIYGRVDDVVYDPVATVIRLTGRDLTAAFIDRRIAQEYVNQTASQVSDDDRRRAWDSGQRDGDYYPARHALPA